MTKFESLSKEEFETINGGGVPSYVRTRPSFSGVSCTYEAWKWSQKGSFGAKTGGCSCISR